MFNIIHKMGLHPLPPAHPVKNPSHDHLNNIAGNIGLDVFKSAGALIRKQNKQQSSNWQKQ